jgi:hypothetical protein
MEALEGLLQDRGIVFCSLDNRIRCFPHIINICSTHVIKSFDEQAEFDMQTPPGNAATEAVKRHPIALCRSTV